MKKLYRTDREIKLHVTFQVQKINLYLAVDVIDYISKIKVQVSLKEFSIISKGTKNSLPNCSICKIFQPIFPYTLYLCLFFYFSFTGGRKCLHEYIWQNNVFTCIEHYYILANVKCFLWNVSFIFTVTPLIACYLYGEN